MNWRVEAVSKLKEYPARKQAVAGLPAEIQCVNLQYQNAQGAGEKDAALSAVALIQELQTRLKETELWLSFVEGGLDALDEEELKVLDCFFIHPVKEKVAALGMSLQEAYRIRDRALRRFTFALYGISE